MKKIILIALIAISTINTFGQVSRSRLKTPTYSWINRQVPIARYLDSTFASFWNIVDDGIPALANNVWELDGNAIATNTNFIGTTTNRSFHIKTNTTGGSTGDFKVDSSGHVVLIADTNTFNYPFRILGSYQNNAYMELNGPNISGYVLTNKSTGNSLYFANQIAAGGFGVDAGSLGSSSNPSLGALLFSQSGAAGARVSLRVGSSVIPTATLDVTGNLRVSTTGTVSGNFQLGADLAFSTKVINTVAGDAATINSNAGRFRKDASGTTFVLTNSQITANSIIVLTAANAAVDATAVDWTILAGAGSATITFGVAPTANFDMNFLIIN